MTQEERQLLFIDLCSRLPYGIKVQFSLPNYNTNCFDDKIGEVFEIGDVFTHVHCGGIDYLPNTSRIKPYLRPMSSMTYKEREEWADLFNLELDKLNEIDDENKAEELAPYYFGKSHQVSIDWLNKKMFDYRGLIPMGIALEAPEDMYKTE